MKTKSLGDRMKGYERNSDTRLTSRLPAFLRIDGKCFHTLTKRWECDRPFDEDLTIAMQQTMQHLCENIQGAVIGYTQSDEITIGFIDYQNLQSTAWFDKRVQKMCSVAASMATKAFNYYYHFESMDGLFVPLNNWAEFDCRVFVLPPNEVVNLLIWRQQDWSRNSISMAARSVISHKKCHKKNCDELQEMLFQKGINWNEYSTVEKRGSCAIKVDCEFKSPNGEKFMRSKWTIDRGIPIFTQDREYISKRFEPEEP